jgi:hypothetical protein
MATRFTTILKSLIVEGAKMDALLDKYTKPKLDKEGKKVKPLLSKDMFLQLIQADPDTKMNNVDPATADEKELMQIKPGGYSEWIIRHYLKPEIPEEYLSLDPQSEQYKSALLRQREVYFEDLFKLTNDLMKFKRFKGRIEGERDLNKMKPSQLYDKVKDFSLEKIKASAEEKKKAQETYEHPGGDVIFRGDQWTVARVSDTGALGKDAACFYGGNYLEPSKGETRWCTSAPGLSWFDRYIKDGPLYVVIPNNWEGQRGIKSNLPAERYQFHFPSNQFMDVHDRSVDLVQLLNGSMSELKDIFKHEFAKGLTVGGEKFVVDSFTTGPVGKFIALYGLDELIDSIPNSIKSFSMTNNDKNLNVNIKIPESISRFQNLKTIILNNCVSSVPDSICELRKLNFITILNCPELRTVPECIADMPKILMLNLMGSNNVEVPQKIKEKARTPQGSNWKKEGMWDFALEDDDL